MNQAIADPLDESYRQYFEPLVSLLPLTDLRREVQGMGGIYEAHGKNTAVRLVNDRGLLNFDVFSLSRPKLCWCDVGLLSELLEPPREEEKIIRTLDLESQAKVLRSHWSRIEQLFSQESAEPTACQLNKLGSKRSKNMFK